MTESRPPRAARFALAGIAMPIWFLGLATVLGATRGGYDPLRDALSELGARGAPDPLLWQVGGFGVAAVLLFLYALSLRAVFGAGWLFVLTVVVAASLGASAVAPCDPGCPPIPESTTMLVHTIAGLTGLASFAVIPIVGWRTFRRRTGWRSLARFSAVVGAALVALFIVGPALGPDRIGLWQRTFLPIAFAWQVVVAWRLAAVRRAAAAGVAEPRATPDPRIPSASIDAGNSSGPP